jgi:hypothetical protein
MNFTKLYRNGYRFNGVRKVIQTSCSDGNTYYTKVVDNLITNLTEEQPFETEL